MNALLCRWRSTFPGTTAVSQSLSLIGGSTNGGGGGYVFGLNGRPLPYRF
ncbi:MAG: hypothetical protein KA773_16540 [Chloroflexi bacterium]|nr:hypothetical protein [Chloroflexota bacterium]